MQGRQLHQWLMQVCKHAFSLSEEAAVCWLSKQINLNSFSYSFPRKLHQEKVNGDVLKKFLSLLKCLTHWESGLGLKLGSSQILKMSNSFEH